MKIKLALMAIALAGLGATAANATVYDYTITGTGSGSLNGVNFTNASFTFTSVGDDANYANHGPFSSVDPLASTDVLISGFSDATIGIPTRLFSVNSNGVVGLSRAGNLGADLFDFGTPAPVNLDSLFGPINATTDAFALNQFQNVATSEGLLSFDSATSIVFSDTTTGVPEPATWALMLAGVAGLGVTLRRARKTTAATAA